MEQCLVKNMYDLNETIAAQLFAGADYPWEVLGKISDFIINLGNSLDSSRYENRGENIWIAKSANQRPYAIYSQESNLRHNYNAAPEHC